MSCHQVETNFHATLMGLIDQCNQIGIGTESRIHLVEIDDIIATIKPSRLKDRIEPEGVHTQRLDVIQLGSDTRQIANTVAIRIHIGRWINLIEKSITQPSRSLLLFCLNRKCGCRQSRNQQHFFHSFHKQHYLFKKKLSFIITQNSAFYCARMLIAILSLCLSYGITH